MKLKLKCIDLGNGLYKWVHNLNNVSPRRKRKGHPVKWPSDYVMPKPLNGYFSCYDGRWITLDEVK